MWIPVPTDQYTPETGTDTNTAVNMSTDPQSVTEKIYINIQSWGCKLFGLYNLFREKLNPRDPWILYLLSERNDNWVPKKCWYKSINIFPDMFHMLNTSSQKRD